MIGLGRVAAGDDGVGPAVLAELRRRGVPAGVELVEARDPSLVVELVGGVDVVVLVDAVVAEGVAPGTVVEAGPGELAARTVRPLTTHGIDAARALELARVLDPAGVAARIVVVGVAIEPGGGPGFGLGPAVAAGVGEAAERVLALLGGAPAAGEP